jgi:sugar lactone lactonase YvrE
LKTIDDDAHYPEGPLYIDGTLHWVEFVRDAVMILEPGARNKRVLWRCEGVGPAAVARGAGEVLWLTGYGDNTVVCIGRGGETREVLRGDAAGRPFLGPNDLVLDERGGLYFTASGVFELDAPVQGEVYYRAPDGGVRSVADAIHYANGLALTPDGGALYVAEHLQNRVLRYEVGPGGALSGRRVFAELARVAPPPRFEDPRLGPDGMKVAADGRLLVAQYGGGRVIALDPGGGFAGELRLPHRFTTNVALEPAGERLWITAFAAEEAPCRGGVFEARSSSIE